MTRSENQDGQPSLARGNQGFKVLRGRVGPPLFEIDEQTGTFEIFEWNKIDRLPLFKKIMRSLNMGPRLCTKRKVIDKFPVFPGNTVVRPSFFKTGIAWEDEILNPVRDIDQAKAADRAQDHFNLLCSRTKASTF